MSPALLGVWRIAEAGTPPQPLPEAEIIRDVEKFVGRVIERMPTARELSHADQEELFGALLERVVILTRRYDRSRDDPSQRASLRFDLWLYQRLRLAAIDELRSWLGRQGQKRVVDERLLAATRRDVGVDDGGDPRLDGRDDAASASARDDGRDRVVPASWLRPPRDRGSGLTRPAPKTGWLRASPRRARP